MLVRKLPFKENGWWVVYDFAIVQKNKSVIKVQNFLGKSFLVLSLSLLLLFFLPFTQTSSYTEAFTADENFSLIIPKLSINVPVSPNVDPRTRNISVAHAKGTAFPGEPGNVFIFGHSSDYPWSANPLPTVFLTLSTLSTGDKIYLIYKSEVYTYVVSKQDIVNSDEISYLRPDSNSNKLYLQTCWPIGTDWQRLIVTATLDKGNPIL